MNKKKKNLAIFVSGSGTNFEAVQRSILNKEINGRIVLLISSQPHAGALEKANSFHIDSYVIKQKEHNNFEEYEYEMVQKLKQYNIDFIILAGFLKKVPSAVIKTYKNRIINIHPALLPKFGGQGMYGIHVHEAVIKADEKETGVTVHFVDEKYDEGAIIAQVKVPVQPGDSAHELQQRVLTQEHKLLPQAVQWLCDDRVRIENNKVIIKEKG